MLRRMVLLVLVPALLLAGLSASLIAYRYGFHRAGRLLVENQQTLVLRDYRRDYSLDRAVVPEEKFVRPGQKLRVWVDVDDPQAIFEGPLPAVPFDELRHRTSVYFNFDPRELERRMLNRLDCRSSFRLDSDMTIVEVFPPGLYQPPDIWDKHSIASISPDGRLESPQHIAGPAKVVRIDEETWPARAQASESSTAGATAVFTVVVPENAKSGWICAVTDLSPEKGGGYSAWVSWSLYGGYVYVKD